MGRRGACQYIICMCWSLDGRYLLEAQSEDNSIDGQHSVARLVVYDAEARGIYLFVDERAFPALKASAIIQVIGCHPTNPALCFYGDLAGQVVLLDFLRKQLLNIFWLTATHIHYPQL
jgi:hypothetical protein